MAKRHRGLITLHALRSRCAERLGPFGSAAALGAGSVLAVEVLRLVLFSGLLGHDAPLMLYLAAVMSASWVGGFRAGVVATALAALAGTCCVLEPHGSLRIDLPTDRHRLGLFAGIGLFVSWLNDSRRAAARQSEARSAEIVRQHGRLESAHAELAGSEDRYRTLIELSPQIVWAADAAGAFTYASPNFETTTGLTTARAAGDGWLEAVHAADREHAAAAWREAVDAAAPFSAELRLRPTAGGVSRWHLMRARPVRDAAGRVLRWSGIAVDVHDRRVAEQARRRGEAPFRRLAESNLVGVVRADESGAISEVNGNFLSAIGYTLAELKAERPTLPELTPPEYAGRDAGAFEQAAKAGACVPYEKELVRRDGGRVPVLVGFAALDPAPEGGERADGDDTDSKSEFGSVYVSDGVPVRRSGDAGAADPPPAPREHIYFILDRTEQKRKEDSLRFLAELNDDTRTLVCPTDTVAAAARRLCDHLGADGCFYAEVGPDGDGFRVVGGHAHGAAAVEGEHRLADFGREVLRSMRGDRRFVTDDVGTDPRAAGAAVAFRQFGARAVVCKPLHKNGRLVAVMMVHQAAPRRWGAGEPELVRLALTRCWESLERSRVLRDLHASEQRFRQMADSIPQLAWKADADGRITWFNRRWFEYTGGTPDAMAGDGWHAVHDPDVLPQVLDGFDRAVAAGEAWEDTFPLRRRDGQMRWHLARMVPLKDDDGTVVRWFGTATDITERREMEASLREADRRKDEFLATLAHELRNPLAPVRNAVQLMGLERQHPGRSDELLGVIDRQVGRMVRLIDDLLDISRISRGVVELRPEPVELGAVLDEAVEAARPQIDAAGHHLEVDRAAADLVLDADAARLAQVVTNLLVNAAKYTPAGGHVRLSAAEEGGQAVVRVRDDGEGIARDQLGGIFEPFVQIDRTLDSRQSGLGIGLTLVKRLVELHGGSVSARSAGRGAGSEFIVRLPLAEAEAEGATGVAAGDATPASADDPPAPPPHDPGPLRVLVVEDHRIIARTFARLLEALGHTVRIAGGGAEALAETERDTPDVIFSDISMPGMSGYELAERLRDRPHLADTLLVAVTGYGGESDRRRALDAGFDAHLPKPADLADVRAVLRTAPVRRRVAA